MAPSANRLLRWRHLLIPGRGSIARTSDRVQAGLVLVVIVVALVAIPFSAAAGSAVYAAQKQQSVRELAEDRPAIATLLADGPPVSVTGRSGEVGVPRPTDATWPGPDGTRHTGQVKADAGTHRGDQVQIWVDGSGAVVAAPLSSAAAVVNAVAAAVGLYFVTCLALALAYGTSVFALNRRRGRKWQQEWYAELAKRAHS
ncbi:hypothetical protein [Amycolatopsis sp. FDAARGOS 1241]|uniref:Rv1733c family protein n=1 Tax=Amycolatopsis sp. FDAARGOS 1241 TaxID=2778070 RepID=UPI0019502095|nr:hypothetical protein [Amycolatopsis sp. FDAARGOS 1241]QRP42917.1 hypothetical protein I6J71_26010 [Amycolatopsis sp. FDAARGOS 1241]